MPLASSSALRHGYNLDSPLIGQGAHTNSGPTYLARAHLGLIIPHQGKLGWGYGLTPIRKPLLNQPDGISSAPRLSSLTHSLCCLLKQCPLPVLFLFVCLVGWFLPGIPLSKAFLSTNTNRDL